MCIYITPALALVVLTQRMASGKPRRSLTELLVQNGCESVSEAAIYI